MTTIQSLGFLLIIFALGWEINRLGGELKKLQKKIWELEARVAQKW